MLAKQYLLTVHMLSTGMRLHNPLLRFTVVEQINMYKLSPNNIICLHV